MLEKIKQYGLWFFNSFIWLGLLLLVIDIVTKNVVVNNCELGVRNVLIPGFLSITYTVNTNAAFGIGLGNELANRIVYIIVALIAIAIIIVVYVKKYKVLNRYYKAVMMMILVGALGNLIDRTFFTPEYLRYSSVGVVDWIDFYGIWPYIFNWADSCIVVGVIMLVIYLIVDEINVSRKNKKVILTKDQVEAKIEQAEKEKSLEDKEVK